MITKNGRYWSDLSGVVGLSFMYDFHNKYFAVYTLFHCMQIIHDHIMIMMMKIQYKFIQRMRLFYHYYTVWVKKNPPPSNFLTFFPKVLGIFSPNFARLLYVPVYAGLQIFIQLSATLMKLCHNKSDHYNVLKMSTIDRNERWVVALNMA